MRIGARTAGVVAVTLTAGLLAGCAGNPGVAATAGERTITHEELSVATDQLLPLLDGAASQSVLAALILAPALIDAAAENGAAASEAEAAEVLDGLAANRGVPVQEWSEESITVVQLVMASQNLAARPDAAEVIMAAEQEALAQDVEVNPRYGTFDPESGSVVTQQLPWIVQELEAPEAQ